MKKHCALIWITVLSFIATAALAQQNHIVKRGERPPINLQSVPGNAYERGVIKIKVNRSFTVQMDNNPVMMGNDGIVRFNITGIDKLNQQYGAKGFNKLFESKSFSPEFSERHRAWGFHLWYTLYFDKKSDVKELVRAYMQLDEVSVAEPEYIKKMISSVPATFRSKTGGGDKGLSQLTWLPNDPDFYQQWHYDNTGQQGGTPDADIDLPEAWDIERGNPNVIVCIEDGGIQYEHPDLAGNMWSGLGWDFVNDDATIEPDFHGTHVAGTVAAVSNNGIGVSGVAGGSGSNDGVRLMSCQVFTNSSSGGFHLAPVYAADNGACISQNSWAYTAPNTYEQSVLDAIDYFNANGGGNAIVNGGITIFAAGNSASSDTYYPAYYSGTFAVAATTNQDIKAYYSNFGSWVDISAPGGETNVVDAEGVLSTITGSSYGFMAGTSMACPHTSGVAALIVSLAYNFLTPGDVADIILTTTDDIDGVNPGYVGQLGTGRLNAYQALLKTQTYLILTADFEGTPTSIFSGNSVIFDDLSNAPDSIISYSWTFPGGTPSSANTAGPHNIIYTAPGSYSVSLTVDDGASTDTETKTNYISVSNCFNCPSEGNMDFQTSTTLVGFNMINNSSAKPAAYNDYTSLSTDVAQGTTYNLTVNINTDGAFSVYSVAWIDWNKNCDFSDPGETYNLGSAYNVANGPVSASPYSISVPAEATLGSTRMRISTKYFGYAGPCETGFDGEVEDYTINVIADALPGDDCATAQDLSTLTSPYSATTTGYSNIFDICSMGSSADRIFYIDVPFGCEIEIWQSWNDYDSRHTMRYAGNCPGDIEIGCIDDDDYTPISWTNNTGQLERVWFIVAGYGSGSGDFTLEWSLKAINDDCANALAINEVSDLAFDTRTAMPSGVQPSCGGLPPADIWYAFSPSLTGIATFDLCGSSFDTRLSIWDTCGGTEIACNDDNGPACPGVPSSIELWVTTGTTYYVQVGGYETISGVGDLTIQISNNPPVADFEADIINPVVDETVSFTDLSTNSPDSWSWVFTPSTFTYVGGTNANSQNPQVQFNATGNYTVGLTVGNSAGNNTETKVDYINVQYPVINVEVSVFLEGPYFGPLMNTGINAILPSSQPFNVSPWNYNGTENATSIATDIVDWVLIDIRDATSVELATASTSIGRQAAFLRNDGKVIGMDGSPILDFTTTLSNNLYVAVYQRNHISIISAYPLVSSGGIYNYDFSSGDGQAYGTGSQKNLGAGVYGMFAADADADGNVNPADKSIWAGQAGINGYNTSDFDMDGQVGNPDKNENYVPNIGKASNVPQ
ncbi:MAG: S8 family serine peptidase [Chlorobi bacterium]|nr:S8 family serine peptidase [Chlorobiota bacterium]